MKASPQTESKPQASVLLRKIEVAQRLGCSTWSVDRWVRIGLFPKPIFLTPNAPARWKVSDIDAWVDKRKVSRHPRRKVRGVLRQFAEVH